MACAAFTTFVAATAAAQPATFVVTGAREPLAVHQVAADVVVIDAERIRASGADSVEDLLRREAGLQLLRNGGPGQSAGLSIRGASRGQTLLLIDGVRVGSATLGTPELDTLTLAGIERIEVLRGPGSSLFGADAIGGVVQVVTRRAAAGAQPVLSLRAAAGGYGAREGSAGAEGQVGVFDLAASLAGERQRGASALRPGDPFGSHNPDGDGYSRRSASARVGFTPAAGHRVGLSLFGGRLDNQYDGTEFAPPTFTPDSSGDFRNRTRAERATLEYRGAPAPAWTLTARAAGESSRSVSGASLTSRFATEREQATVQLSREVAEVRGQFTLAVEQAEETGRSTDYAADATRRNRAAVLAYAGGLGLPGGAGPGAPLALQAEVRRDRNTAFGDHTTGRLGVRWPVPGAGGEDSPWSLRALVGTSFRAPSFNDLVYPGYGVPTIRPEKGRSVELGIDVRGAELEGALTVYRNDLRDLIGYEPDAARCPPDPAYAFGCAANVQRARLQGASLDGRWRWAAAGGGFAAARLEWLDATDRATGQVLPRRAEWQGGLSFEQRVGAVRLGAELMHVGQREDFGVTLPSYTTLDLVARWRPAAWPLLAWAEGLEVQAKLLNATDRDIEPLLGYQALGRQAWLVLRWQGAF